MTDHRMDLVAAAKILMKEVEIKAAERAMRRLGMSTDDKQDFVRGLEPIKTALGDRLGDQLTKTLTHEELYLTEVIINWHTVRAVSDTTSDALRTFREILED